MNNVFGASVIIYYQAFFDFELALINLLEYIEK